MLLHGLKRRRPAFVLAWLVVDGIGLVLCVSSWFFLKKNEECFIDFFNKSFQALFTVLFLLFWIYLAAGDNKEVKTFF